MHQHQLRVAGKFAGNHQLLRVAPGEQRSFLFQRTHALHIEPGHRLGGLGLQALAPQIEERTVAPAVNLPDAEVLGHRQLAGQCRAVAVSGDRSDAQLAPLFRAGPAQVAEARQVQRALAGLRQPHQHVGQFALAVASDSSDTIDLAGTQAQRHAI